jgi:hypothetical protein
MHMSDVTSLAAQRLPDHIRNGLYQYVQFGTMPGSFLKAVLENDLQLAFRFAERDMVPHIQAIASYIYWEVPGPCHGSPDAVQEWSRQGGEVGRSKR